jgi:hypothetical protein
MIIRTVKTTVMMICFRKIVPPSIFEKIKISNADNGKNTSRPQLPHSQYNPVFVVCLNCSQYPGYMSSDSRVIDE